MTPTLSPEASYLGGTVRGYIRPQWISLPAGTATIGSRADEGYESERPQHRVQLKAFEISRSEVTVLQYAQCVTAGYCSDVGLNHTDWGESRLCNWGHIERADHPLNCVSWHQAQRYAEWVGGRLPSEAEWSYAAQGGSSQPIRYPWGDDEPSCDRVVIADEVKGAGCGLERTAPVCSRPLGHSKLSACDMVGNVWEWVEDEWHADYRGAPRDGAPWYNPLSDERVYRGGGAFNDRDFPRIARRHKRLPEARLFNLGFRVARGLNPRGSGALDGSVRDTESAKAGDPETRDPETRDPETRDPETGSPETRDPEARPAQGRRRPGRYDRLFERPGLIGE